MKFIEMTGKTLLDVIDENEITPQDLRAAGLKDDTLVRVNTYGDIEIRKSKKWDVIGGLLGDFEARVKKATRLDWA